MNSEKIMSKNDETVTLSLRIAVVDETNQIDIITRVFCQFFRVADK